MTVLNDLETTIAARKTADPDSSWTAKLLSKGPEKCAEKFGEEAIEAIIEAIKGDREKLTSEAADVLYHLLVMLAALLASQQQRAVDQALLTTLGAAEAVINRIDRLEFALLATLAAGGGLLVVMACLLPLGLLLFDGGFIHH